jgi:hypothetical protein
MQGRRPEATFSLPLSFSAKRVGFLDLPAEEHGSKEGKKAACLEIPKSLPRMERKTLRNAGSKATLSLRQLAGF